MKENNYPIPKVSQKYRVKATKHMDSLTKPIGSLGFLETIAIELFAIYGEKCPFSVDSVFHFTIAGDHGITRQNVTLYPQEVTRQMVYNFLSGGGAINVLCRTHSVDFAVVDAGCIGEPFQENELLINARIVSGTQDCSEGCAMSLEDAKRGIALGHRLAKEKIEAGYTLLTIGEMGIGNSTIATALCCAFLGISPEETTGAGAGISQKVVKHKICVIKKILEYHKYTIEQKEPIAILASIGGAEFAVMAGILIGASMCGIPVVVDGFIATSAYLVARAIAPAVEEYVFIGHCSAEQAHVRVLQAINKRPILHLDMRLGEGTGAVLAVPIIRSAVAIYKDMATFDSAGITKGI